MADSVADEIAPYPVEDWIVWLGAGISLAPPTSLPSGARLTWFSIEQTCGPGVKDRIERMWNRFNRLVRTPANETPLGSIPRLETILGEVAIAEASSLGDTFRFMRGFEAFAHAPPNENHALAAALVAAGATVVTTNFDLCIQSAYRGVPGYAPLRSEPVGNTVRYFKSDGSRGEIWHAHGVASDTAGLGATVAQVKEGFPPEFAEMLQRRLRSGVAVVFLGYSASDSFDVTPFFANLETGRIAGSHAVFVQHKPFEVPLTAGRLLRRFTNPSVHVLDTTAVLRELVAHARVAAPVPGSGAFDWTAAFLARAGLAAANPVRDYLICRVANVLGVNVHLLAATALAGAEVTAPLYEPVEYHKTMAVAYRPIGDAEKEREHDDAVKRDERDMLGYLFAQGRLEEARERAMRVAELLAHPADDGELDWHAYTSMSVHCRLELRQRIRPFARPPRGAELSHVADLVRIARTLGERPYRGVRFINQIATARRFSFLFEALLNGREDKDAIDEVLALYGDAASVAGFISTWRDVAIARFFLVRYHRQWRMQIPALTAAVRSLRLARAAGDRASTRRAAMLLARIAPAAV